LHKDIKSRPRNIRALPDETGALIWLGRFLLTLSAMSLITTPLTQHLWTWDHFLRGGQDFELAAFMLLTAFGLVLVLSRHCRQRVDLLLASSRLLARKFGTRDTMNISVCVHSSIVRIVPASSAALDFYSIPLQI